MIQSSGQYATVMLVFARIYRKATKLAAAAFLKVLTRTVPSRIHTILTDNGVQFVDRYQGVSQTWIGHIFGRTCQSNGIEHRLTKPNHPWTNGQVERMTRTIKEATVKRYHYRSHKQLRAHLQTFIDAYNFARRLKTLRGLTPYEHICKCWTDAPKRFKLNPLQDMPGLNT